MYIHILPFPLFLASLMSKSIIEIRLLFWTIKVSLEIQRLSVSTIGYIMMDSADLYYVEFVEDLAVSSVFFCRRFSSLRSASADGDSSATRHHSEWRQPTVLRWPRAAFTAQKRLLECLKARKEARHGSVVSSVVYQGFSRVGESVKYDADCVSYKLSG